MINTGPKKQDGRKLFSSIAEIPDLLKRKRFEGRCCLIKLQNLQKAQRLLLLPRALLCCPHDIAHPSWCPPYTVHLQPPFPLNPPLPPSNVRQLNQTSPPLLHPPIPLSGGSIIPPNPRLPLFESTLPRARDQLSVGALQHCTVQTVVNSFFFSFVFCPRAILKIFSGLFSTGSTGGECHKCPSFECPVNLGVAYQKLGVCRHQNGRSGISAVSIFSQPSQQTKVSPFFKLCLSSHHNHHFFHHSLRIKPAQQNVNDTDLEKE